MPDPLDIPTDALRACLRERYGVVAASVEFLPRGFDYQAGVYRVASERGGAYLLKATARPLYEPSLLIPRALHDLGLAAVVAPLSTVSGTLWAALGSWTVTLYPFLDGDTSLSGMTEAQWREVGSVFRRIHEAAIPLDDLPSLRVETFDPSAYARWARGFDGERALRAVWRAQRDTVLAAVDTLERLGAALRVAAPPLVIAHGDLHAANLLRDAAGHIHVLDWDEVRLAPKERDFLFIREPHASGFWAGYSIEPESEINWAALTYFRWERVLQDLMEEAAQARRDDVSADARETATRRFAATFAPGGNADAARDAERRLG